MALPVFTYFIIFKYLPMYGVVISFQRFVPAKGIFRSEWVGIENFLLFFKDIYFWRTIRNTFLINFYGLIFGFPIPIIFALLLTELSSSKLRTFTQTISYAPHFISAVVVCGLVVNFLRTDGIITTVLVKLFGFNRINMLSRPEYFRTIYTSMNIWQGFGWGSIIYFAALTSVDPELYEAISIDGANRFQQVIHVSIPSIMPTIVIMLILRMGSMMSEGFERIILLYSPVIYETADVISSYVYRRGLQMFDYSYAAAVGLFNSVVNLIFLLSANNISRKVSESSIW
jgi:putative aldouronate transport system permease protein